MMKHRQRAFLTIVATLSVVGAAAPASSHENSVFPVSKWSERGVFAFSGVNFDFFYQRWGAGAIGGSLKDCSSSTNYCMDALPFRLVLPRDCKSIDNADAGTVWKEGDVQTEVLFSERAQLPPLHGQGRSNTTYYLGDPAIPYVVFEYDRNLGVKRIFHDSARGTNFADMARKGELSKWVYGYAFDRTKANKVYGILTFDNFGACGIQAPLSKLNIGRQ